MIICDYLLLFITMNEFKILGLSENSLAAIEKKGFEEPTPIQKNIIPLLLNEDIDLIGQAQTGTGKTAAFALPIIDKLRENQPAIQTLVLVPTRELALQVSEEINSLTGKKKLHAIPIYGGQSIDQQIRKIKKGVDIVVGTPGRMLDLIRRRIMKLGNISFCVLDEADEMLNMGFIEDIEEILKHTNSNKRMLLFSATIPERIVILAKKYMNEFKTIRIAKEQLTLASTDQIYFEVNYSDKLEALCRIIDIEEEFYGIIFCRTKINVSELTGKLIDRGYDADALHGDISQAMREKILGQFKKKRINVLVATDVAARGIDIIDLTHVINYSLPQDPESYVHRIGRTGRAGKEGTAITFITPEEYRKLTFIKRIAKTDIRKEKLPKIKDIINIKKSRIKASIENVITEQKMNEYEDIADDLLNSYNPKEILTALLKLSFQDELAEKNYSPIGDVLIDKKGTTRLFVALGKFDKMNAGNIAKFIEHKTNVKSRNIRNIEVFDKFSFITVPFREAETILRYFKKRKKGKPPIVVKAKKRN